MCPEDVYSGHCSTHSIYSEHWQSNYGHHSYADDNQLYASCIPSKSAALKVKMIRRTVSVGEWIASNRLVLNPSKSEFMWSSSPTSHSSHRQISVRPSGWSSRRLNKFAKSHSIFRQMHVYEGTRQPSGALERLPTATYQIYPSLFVACGGDESHKLVHHNQSRLLWQHSRRANKAPNRPNPVNPQRRSARYLWTSTFQSHHVDFERPTPLAESTAKVWIQAVPARVQGNHGLAPTTASKFHQDGAAFIRAPTTPRSPSFQGGDARRTSILDRRADQAYGIIVQILLRRRILRSCSSRN